MDESAVILWFKSSACESLMKEKFLRNFLLRVILACGTLMKPQNLPIKKYLA